MKLLNYFSNNYHKINDSIKENSNQNSTNQNSKMFLFLTKHHVLIGVIILAFILRIIHLSHNYSLWWDSNVYLGVAKYVYTFGNAGLWEPYRPLIHPLLIGFFWKLGANVVLIGKLFDLIFSLTTIILTYNITKQIFSKKAALYSAFILAIEPLFIMFTGLILTEPLALTLSLLAIYLFINRRSILILDRLFPKKEFSRSSNLIFNSIIVGSVFSFAALTKFPLAIIFFAVLISGQILTYIKKLERFQMFKFLANNPKNKNNASNKLQESNCQKETSFTEYRAEVFARIKENIFLCFGFSIPMLIFLLFNYYMYSDPLFPFKTGAWIVTTALWLYNTNFWFYFTNFFGVHHIFSLFFISILLFIYRKDFKDENRTIIFLTTLLLFLYFWLNIPRKEVRYMVIIFPFFTILIGDVIEKLEKLLSILLTKLVNSLKSSKLILKLTSKLKSKKIESQEQNDKNNNISKYSRIQDLFSRFFSKHSSKLITIFILLIILVMQNVPNNTVAYTYSSHDNNLAEIGNYINEHNLDGPILSSTPFIIEHVDNKIYPTADISLAPLVYIELIGQYNYLIINDCDYVCQEGDSECKTNRSEFLDTIEEENIFLLSKTYEYSGCTVSLYEANR